MEQLKEQIRILDKIIKNLEKSIKSGRVNEELSLTYSKHKDRKYQYYLVDKDGNRSYVKKKDIDTVRKIAQREYDEAALKVAKVMRNRAIQFLKLYDFSDIEKVYDELCEARKALVAPVVMPIDDYISEWRKLYPGSQNPYPYEEEFTTDRGEIVRSKSEKIIADLFNKYDIPYVCEPKVRLFNGKFAYPDFAVLNKRTRKIYYWEHFGRIDFEDYGKRNFTKLCEYEKSGVLLVEDLLVSMESKAMPLDIKQIEEKIKRYLL